MFIGTLIGYKQVLSFFLLIYLYLKKLASGGGNCHGKDF